MKLSRKGAKTRKLNISLCVFAPLRELACRTLLRRNIRAWKGAFALIGSQSLSATTLVERSLATHDVADLESQASQGSQLFRVQLAANSQLHLNSHSQLRGLRCCEFIDSLFNQVFVGRVGVECLVEGDIRFAHSAVCHLALVFCLLRNHSNFLPLLGCETEL